MIVGDRKSPNREESEHLSTIPEPVPTSVISKPVTFKTKKLLHPRTVYGTQDIQESTYGSHLNSTTVRKPTSKRRSVGRNKNIVPRKNDDSAKRPGHDAKATAVLRPSVKWDSMDNTSITNNECELGRISDPGLDITSKFGASVALGKDVDYLATGGYETRIPSTMEIAEKKERRRRLVQQQEFIALENVTNTNHDAEQHRFHSDNSETDGEGQFVTETALLAVPNGDRSSDLRYAESRLLREDEDFAEDFDDFTEDSGKVVLNPKMAKAQELERRNQITEQIRSAQHGNGDRIIELKVDSNSESEDGVDLDEVANNRAYEAAQTRRGRSLHSSAQMNGQEETVSAVGPFERSKLPKTKTIPEIKLVIERFGDIIEERRKSLLQKKKILEELMKDRQEIEKEEIAIKSMLDRAGEQFGKLHREATSEKSADIALPVDTQTDGSVMKVLSN